jgi:pimeloyl-ACP methyl ester carboxylesterase
VTHVVRLATGAELRVTGPSGAPAVVCVNGGRRAEVPGTWSATLEWLVDRLAPRFPKLAFGEVRYRVKSWRRLDSCVADARAAMAAMSPPRALLLGFSMGGAVAVGAADDPAVRGVLGLAPGSPTGCRSTRSAVAGWRCCTVRSIATCPGSRESTLRTRAAASSGHARSVSTAVTS